MKKRLTLGLFGPVCAAVMLVGLVLATPVSAGAQTSTGLQMATTYNSTATANAGGAATSGFPGSGVIPLNGGVTATPANSPQSAHTGIGTLANALQSVPTIGPALAGAFPAGNLTTESATANSAGFSAACAALLSGDCTTSGTPQPIVVNLSLGTLQTLTGGITGTLASALLGPLGTLVGGSPLSTLSGYGLLITLSGPQASCTAGPAGSPGNNFTASQTPASGSIAVVNGTQTLAGPFSLTSGTSILSAIPSPFGPVLQTALGPVLGPSNFFSGQGTTTGAGSGPVTTATAGVVGVNSGPNTSPLFSAGGASVSCGPNDPAPATAAAPAGNSGAPTTTTPAVVGDEATPAALASAPAPETPLGGGISTDEGRWVPRGQRDMTLWFGLIGGGIALICGASGLTIWRRKVRHS